VTLERIAASWSAVLKRLEDISRTSWLLATAVQPLAYDTESEVLTLGFTSQHDVQKFKGSVPGSGPSDHLRTAIEQELGVTVKYRPAPMPAGGTPRQPSSSAPSTGDAPSASEPASARSSRPQSRSESSAPVTEWAVASIPAASSDAAAPATLGSGAPTAPTAEAAAAASIASVPVAAAATASVVPSTSVAGTSSDAPVQMPQQSVETAEAPRRDSSSAPAPAAVDEPPYDDEPPYYDDEPPYDPAYEPASVGAPVARPTGPASPAPAHTAPASSAPASSASASAPSPSPVRPQSAPVVTERAPGGGVQRYGEAVIRQVLGATFVREEPYEPPTRFN
jgi:DNA polymerase-3 subunit gamma/tau